MLKILDRISAPSFKVRSWFEFVVVCVRVCVHVFETHEMLSKRAHSKCKDICIESGEMLILLTVTSHAFVY